MTVSHMSTCPFLSIGQRCRHCAVSFYRGGRRGRHREVDPLPKVTSGEEAGLRTELRQPGAGTSGLSSISCPACFVELSRSSDEPTDDKVLGKA